MVMESLGIGHGNWSRRHGIPIGQFYIGVDLDMNDIVSVHKTVRIQTMPVECQSYFICLRVSLTIPFEFPFILFQFCLIIL